MALKVTYDDLDFSQSQGQTLRLKQSKEESKRLQDYLCTNVVVPPSLTRILLNYKESYPFQINLSKITDLSCSSPQVRDVLKNILLIYLSTNFIMATTNRKLHNALQVGYLMMIYGVMS
jgi:hypothetical protein